jgi:hypothetical protein
VQENGRYNNHDPARSGAGSRLLVLVGKVTTSAATKRASL